MSSSQKSHKKVNKNAKQDEMKTSQKQLTLEPTIANCEHSGESELLAELRKLQQENNESFRDTKQSLHRLESSVGEIKQQMEKLDERITAVENRVSAAKDRSIRQERAVSYLLKREARLTTKQDDMENRLQQNNIRLYGILEDVEKGNMMSFIIDFFHTTLELQEEVDIKLDRAHRATIPKPKETAPPRSVIVRFLDYSVKQLVLQQAWKQRDIQFQGRRVYFDQDY